MFTMPPPNDDGLNYYTLVTLIDITQTNAVRHYNPAMGESEADYNKKRNQQRNYQAMLQVISLRCQPMLLSTPTIEHDKILKGLNFGSNFQEGNVWVFNFAVEQEGIFDLPGEPMKLLLNDMHNVPIITGLDENVKFEVPIIDIGNPETTNTIIVN